MDKLTARIGGLIAELPPAYFALVMSTGIVSIACHRLGFGLPASLLFWLNLGLYLLLWWLTLVRLSFFPRHILDDLRSPARGVGFFTMVAATGILGSQMAIILAADLGAVVLLILGLGLWLFFMSAVFAAIAGAENKPPLTAALNGLWLVAPVSTQSLSILTCLVAAQFSGYQDGLLFLALCLFLIGGLLALLILSLLFYRLMFLPLTPEDFEPPYWITMGVNAVSAVAGATLATTEVGPGLLTPLHDVLVFLTVCFWAAATLWLPFLVIMMVWRHLIRGVGFSYSPSYWGLVFPLGMYATCTQHLAGLTNLPVLADLARGCLYVALAAWLLTFLGMLRSLLRSLSD